MHIQKVVDINAYRPRKRPDTAAVIREAVDALGLPRAYPCEILGLPYDETYHCFSPNRISPSEWVALCNALYLDINMLALGYSRQKHRSNIYQAIQQKYFHLPKSKQIQDFVREFKRQDKLRMQNELNHYGFKLRWMLRAQRFAHQLKQSLNQISSIYDPLARANAIKKQNLRLE